MSTPELLTCPVWYEAKRSMASKCLENLHSRQSGIPPSETNLFGYREIRPLFAYTGVVSDRLCVVSFTDSLGVRHSVEVPAASLYEAAVLAIVQFRTCGFTEAVINPGTRLSVKAAAPVTTHEVLVSRLNSWLSASGKNPGEQVLKSRLRDLMHPRP